MCACVCQMDVQFYLMLALNDVYFTLSRVQFRNNITECVCRCNNTNERLVSAWPLNIQHHTLIMCVTGASPPGQRASANLLGACLLFLI